jgi:hypothetical protein
MDQPDPAILAALTEKLKASSDALDAVVKADQPQPPTAQKENHP